MKRQIVNYTENTPIEALLNVDKEGNTTARNLYEFLDLEKAHYSRWCKKNIEENPYAEENIDYQIINSPSKESLTGRGNFTDYKLTSDFAKKLSMVSNSERGEQARNYFIAVEKKLKEIALAEDKKNRAILNIVNSKDKISQALAIKEYTEFIEKPLLETIDRYERFLCEKQEILTKKSLANKLDTNPLTLAKILKKYDVYTPIRNELTESFKAKYPNIKLVKETIETFKDSKGNSIEKKNWQYTYEGAKAVVDFLIEKGRVIFTENNGFKLVKE